MPAVCRGMGRQKSIPPLSSKKNGDTTRLLLDKSGAKGAGISGKAGFVRAGTGGRYHGSQI